VTDAECAVILAEFRKLTLGPELSAALDHAIGALARHPSFIGPRVTLLDNGGSIAGQKFDGVLMNSRAIDLAMA